MNLPNWFKQQPETPKQILPEFSWDQIDCVFLDMDGTLLDKYYDDYFWEHFVPEVYAAKNQVDIADARKLLLKTYQSVENTLQWTDLHYWSDRLGLDIVALKREISHLVNIHPHIIDYFKHMQKMEKKLYLVTNAHPKALKVKMEQVPIENWFQRLICSEEVGIAKEQPEFWHKLQHLLPYDKERTLFADDTEKVLHSAREYGIQHLIHIAKPSSRLPVKFSVHYQSIVNFQELIF
ncbi:MAG: HAD hydrolase-like protein [Desulforhopalus sp.]|nr:HAD hydrolase-like protein [Desulforhopalus sp.]